MPCQICETRRPRRYCPGVRGDICTICCGTEREVTVDCPLECEYLQDARRHDRPPAVNPDDFPNQDIRVSDIFLREHEPLMLFLGSSVLDAALRTPGAIDYDVREALEALIRTHRTLESGMYYETRPNNPIAGHICQLVQAAAAEFRQHEQQELGMTRTRDADILGGLVFLQRLELDRNNGRRRGRAFLDFLRGHFPTASGQRAPAAASPLIVP